MYFLCYRVVCRQQGLTGGQRLTPGSLPVRSESMMYKDLVCYGSESDIYSGCVYADELNNGQCTSGLQGRVSCNAPTNGG